MCIAATLTEIERELVHLVLEMFDFTQYRFGLPPPPGADQDRETVARLGWPFEPWDVTFTEVATTLRGLPGLASLGFGFAVDCGFGVVLDGCGAGALEVSFEGDGLGVGSTEGLGVGEAGTVGVGVGLIDVGGLTVGVAGGAGDARTVASTDSPAPRLDELSA